MTMPAGLILVGTLLGWAAVRRRNQARQTAL
jgi:cytochrome c-type biogenesis protein CcmH/NrfF